jgi:hypothetical protein
LEYLVIELEDNIKMSLEEKLWYGMNGIDLTQDGENYQAIMNMVINYQVSSTRRSSCLVEKCFCYIELERETTRAKTKCNQLSTSELTDNIAV